MSRQFLYSLKNVMQRHGIKNELPKGLSGYGYTMHEGHALEIVEDMQRWRSVLDPLPDNEQLIEVAMHDESTPDDQYIMIREFDVNTGFISAETIDTAWRPAGPLPPST